MPSFRPCLAPGSIHVLLQAFTLRRKGEEKRRVLAVLGSRLQSAVEHGSKKAHLQASTAPDLENQ